MLGTPIDLHARNPHLKYYNETLYFAGALPMWNEKFTHISAVSQARSDGHIKRAHRAFFRDARCVARFLTPFLRSVPCVLSRVFFRMRVVTSTSR